MGIRIPFPGIGDKKLRANMEAIDRAAVISVLENTQSGPPGARRGAVTMYAVDNGAGKLRLMAQFPTGAPVQLAIEP